MRGSSRRDGVPKDCMRMREDCTFDALTLDERSIGLTRALVTMTVMARTRAFIIAAARAEARQLAAGGSWEVRVRVTEGAAGDGG